MMPYSAVLVLAIGAPIPRTPVDEWLGEMVFPRFPTLQLVDETGKNLGTWTVTAGKVSWADSEKVLLRTNQVPGPVEGYAKKADLVRLDDAIAFFSTKLKENDKDLWALRYRANAWTLKEQHEKAIEDLTEALKLDPRAYMWIARGNAWNAKKDYDKAIEDYTEAVRLEPRSATGFSNRGNSLNLKKEYEKAIKDFEEALKIDPRHTRAYYLRGTAWKNLKEFDKAIKDLDEAIRLDPRYTAAYYTRGSAWAARKEFDKAIDDCDQAIRLDPKNTTAFYNKACAFALQGKVEPAIDNLQRAIDYGYKDFGHLAKDTDFDRIRNEPAFKEILKKHPEMPDDKK